MAYLNRERNIYTNEAELGNNRIEESVKKVTTENKNLAD